MINTMQYDIVVVGGGVAGCTAAIYGGMSGKKVLLITGPLLGGLLSTTKIVDNYTGIPDIDGGDLANNMVEHAKKYSTVLCDSVTEIDVNNKIVKTYMDSISTKAIIIATGSSPKKLHLPSEYALENKGISYCAICDGFLFKDQDVAIIGGGNSAFEQVKYLAGICKSVTLIHRSEKFRAFQELQDDVKKLTNVKIITNEEVQEFCGDNKLTSIKLKNQSINVTGAFVAIGHIPNCSFVNVEKTEDGYIKVKKNYETNVNGIFACGDVIFNEHMVRYNQAIVAGAEGCIAALETIKYLESL